MSGNLPSEASKLLEMAESRFGRAGPWIVRPILVVLLVAIAALAVAAIVFAFRYIADAPPPPGAPGKAPPTEQVPVTPAIAPAPVNRASPETRSAIVAPARRPQAPAEAAPAPRRQPDGDAYYNNGVNNGIMGPVTISKPPPFVLTPLAINNVINALPRDRAVEVDAVGNERARGMGRELSNAITDAGFRTELHLIGVMAPAPEQPLTVSSSGNKTIVTIDPEAAP